MTISRGAGMLAFLLVFLPVTLAIRPIRSVWSEQDLIHHYDVVTPTLVHPSDQDGAYPEKMTILLKLEREKLTLELTKNKGLLRPNFRYRVQEGQGEKLYEGKENCYYQGRVEEHPDWSVVISTCFGIRGTFGVYSLRNMTFFIEPLEKKVRGKHMVYCASELPDSHFSGKCGSDGHSNPSLDIGAPPALNALRRRKRQSSSSTFFLELYVATDTAAYARRSNNRTMVLHEIVEIVNHMDDFYNRLTAFKVRMALIEVKAYTSSNPISVTRDPSATLTLWKAHFRSNIHQVVPADAALLFAGDGFNDDVLGIAPVGSMCRSSNAGLATLRSSTLASATTAAHELGHMFGLNHDGADCTCVDRQCIMSARISGIPTQWSSCSQTMFATEFNNGNFGDLCLADEPNFVNTDNVVPYVCGNGIREPGEGCDCGSVEECDDPCCNATLCSLRQGAKCYTHEPCCQNCQYKPAGVECRAVSGDCDVAEQCTGSSGECPDNLYLRDGINCTASNEQGFCIDGQCLTRTSQCQRIYGDTAARSAPEVCYDYNTVGNCYGKCSIQQPCGSTCTQIPCDQEDVLCGIIRCVTDTKFPVISTPPETSFATLTCPRGGGVTTILFCLSSYSPELTDPAFVQDFTKCGENKVCMNQKCVAANFGAQTCASNAAGVECNGQGRCLSNNICLCNEGWFGERCDRRTAAPTTQPTTRPITRETTRPTESTPPPVQCPSFGGSECAGNGNCTSDGTCLCNQGWSGFVCNVSACPLGNSSSPCGGQGICTQQGICTCNLGWSGDACDTAAPIQGQPSSAGGIAAGVIVTLIVVAVGVAAVVLIIIFVVRPKMQGKSIRLSRPSPKGSSKSQRHSSRAALTSVPHTIPPAIVHLESNPSYSNGSKEPYASFRPSPPPVAPSRRPAPDIPGRPANRPAPPAPPSQPTHTPSSQPKPPPPSRPSAFPPANTPAAFQAPPSTQPTAPKPTAPLRPSAPLMPSAALKPEPAAKPYPKPPTADKPSARPPLAAKPSPKPPTKPVWPPPQSPPADAPKPSHKPVWPPTQNPPADAPRPSPKPVWPPPQNPPTTTPKPSPKPVWPPSESNGSTSNPSSGRRPLLPPNLR